MLHGLYRMYLYIMYIAMLAFAAIGLGMFLQTLLALTILKDIYNVPTNTSIVQSGTFAVVSWLIAGLVGGLHYWLIRRDMRNDPTAKGGTVRAFFLNFTELLLLPQAVSIGTFTISQLGQLNSGLSSPAAFAIAELVLWAWLDWERSRTQPNPGVASVFQRIHLYGTQLILLFILSTSWITTVGQLVDSLFYGGKGSGTVRCAGFIVCTRGPNLLSLAASTLFIVLFWLWYGYLSRKDSASLFRRVFHFISYGFGFIFVLIGVYRIFTLILLTLFKVPIAPNELSGPGAQYDIVSPLSLGLVAAGIYLFWLRRTILQHPSIKELTYLTVQAVTAVLMAVTLWYGWGLLLLNLLEKVAPSSTPLTGENWAYAIALILTGAGYIPLDLLLRRRNTQAAPSLPLRGFVYALLGASILAIAVGGAIALYAYSTAILGSPLDNWQNTAHIGLAAFITGVIVAALYLWTGLRGGIFARQAKVVPPQPIQPASETATITDLPTVPTESPVASLPEDPRSQAIGPILDQLIAGSISRDEAIRQIEQILKQPA